MKLQLFSLLQKITGASALLALSSIISRGLGLIRDHLLVTNLGASADLDVYYASFRIPDIVYAFLIVSSISVVFLPKFQQFKNKKDIKSAWLFTSAVLNSLLVGYLFLLIFIMILAPIIVNFYVAGFSMEQKELTVHMVRIMLFSPFFFILSSIMIAVENAFEQFLAQAIAPILYNLGIIISILFFYPHFGTLGLAFGVVLGAIMQMLVQIPFFSKTGFKWSRIFLSTAELIDLAKNLLPRLLAVSTNILTNMINTILGASLVAGSITLFNLAVNIQSLPFGVIAISVSVTAFVQLTNFANKEDTANFVKTLKHNVNKIFYWILPAITGLYLLVPLIIDFLFVYKKFSDNDAMLLTNLVRILLISLAFDGFIPILSRAFFAKQQTWPPFLLSLIGFSVNIIVSSYLIKKIGVLGLAIGTMSAGIINTTLLSLVSVRSFGYFLNFKFYSQVILSSIIMFILLQKIIMPNISHLAVYYQLLISSLIGVISYLLMTKFLAYITHKKLF